MCGTSKERFLLVSLFDDGDKGTPVVHDYGLQHSSLTYIVYKQD